MTFLCDASALPAFHWRIYLTENEISEIPYHE